MGKFLSLFLTLVALLPMAAHTATESKTNYPKAASLKRAEVNVRAGPGTRYPILWVFRRKGWPVKIIAKYDNWYKIRDVEGEEGWVYLGMISSKQTAIISTDTAPADMLKRVDQERVLMRLGENVIVGVEECAPTHCKVNYQGDKGWVSKARLDMLP